MLVTLHSSESVYRQQSYAFSSQSTLESHDQGKQQNTATDQLLSKLADKIPGMNANALKNLDSEEFSPDKVSNRIADFVAKGLQQAREDGKSEAEVQQLYKQALAGIEQGFSEARDILEEMNLLTDDIATTIDQTYDLTINAIEALAPSNQQPASFSQSTVVAAERYEQAQSFSLKLKTQDGDKVVINFSNSSSQSTYFGAQSNSEGSQSSFISIDRNQQSALHFYVQGELDEDEITAIQNLIQDVSLIADDFFAGDVQAAFEQASEFKMDKTELAAMRLTLTQSERYSAATAYSQVQDMGDNPGVGKKFGHMMNDLANRAQQPNLDFLNSTVDFSQELLSSLINQDVRYQDADDEKQSLYDQHLEQIRDILTQLTDADISDEES